MSTRERLGHEHNNWPWTAAGADSPKQADFARYMDEYGENPRGLHAVRVLTARNDFTPQTLISAAFDPYLTAFARLIPILLESYGRLPEGDSRKAALSGPINLLKGWDYRWGLDSAPTSLAVFWGEALWSRRNSRPTTRTLRCGITWPKRRPMRSD